MLRTFFVATIAMSLGFSAQAQLVASATPADLPKTAPAPDPDPEKTPPLVISGSADFYYRYDFAKTKANNFTSFTNTHNAFSLGMASLKATYQSDKFSAVLDLGFGKRAEEFSYNDEGLTSAIKQLYISYSPTGWLKLTAGTWATHVGYELVDPQLNRNYSMSYLFTNGPFTHTGIKAEISKGKHGFMAGISNATDFRIPAEGQVNKKFLLAQYSFAPSEDVKLYLNYVGGQAPDTSKSNQFDAVLTAKVNDKFNFAVNGTMARVQSWNGLKNESGQSWWGVAAYLNYDPAPFLGLTLRQEYFSDEKRQKVFSSALAGGHIMASTLSANFRARSFIFIPELRVEKASQPIYADGKSSAVSAVMAVVYSF